ncbi:NAD(P)-dependent oxidoreductase [Actinomadura rupiterrae]|uniref:NAD(P)-dependent oxidoreductase n=1 Tax=Actinomadura rupiterrae TaxID=559627 RepID=UPI0020A45F3C|nr:NAD(P)-binding domain-containing protein [Actinomadura rupiterrae]MCP2335388.1 3-hydroxyisobutyrate dehydrogenase-like beta-hydroxyacid dehydrogenase [Actinomadura rupiterrae]
MNPDNKITLLGLGAMGTALARTWLAAGYELTVWNRTASRAEPLVAQGAKVAASAAEAVAASPLVVVCLLDDASVEQALADADLTGKDVVNITTGTPGQARERAKWATARGARYLDGGIMAVPPMIGVPESGAYVFYSGSDVLFEEHRDALAVPAGTRYVGEDPGSAALHDVALLSAMTAMFGGVSHAFALMRGTSVTPKEFAPLLVEWLTAMSGYVHGVAAQLESGDYTLGVTSNLAMMVQGNATLLRTAEEQGVSAELLTPFMALMERRLADGHPDEGTAGVTDLLKR